jgi:ribosomal protein S12 methylthiotransferase accessory factor
MMTLRPAPRPSMEMAMPMNSNGLASGNHLLEAICAALYEVIERDAVACQMNMEVVAKYRTPIVPLESLAFPLVDELLARFRAAGLKVVVRDCTSDTEVPVYTAYLFDERTRGFGGFAGWGAHLDPEIALIRAITEAAQARVIYISGSRDDLFRLDERQARYEDNPAQLAKKTAHGHTEAVPRASSAGASFEADLTRLLDQLQRVGIRQVLVVDLTKSEIQIPVVRVVVPGLEGYIGHDYIGGARARAAVARARRHLDGAAEATVQ